MEPSPENFSQSDSLIKSVVEAILFISDKPITIDQIQDLIEGASAAEIREAVELVKTEYDQKRSGMAIVEIAGGYQMLTRPDFALYVKRFYRTRHKERLSKPALETLAIIAYKQPVARMDIELIRGVNSDGVVDNLMEKNLIKISGRKEVPGRPYLYATTKEFLEYFGLRSLFDLPKLENFAALQDMDNEASSATPADGQEIKIASTRLPDESQSPATPVTESPVPAPRINPEDAQASAVSAEVAHES